ncbi:hypothetical protein RS030_162550 [Cryptosporidium xiaoi]|uniref:Zinc finger PHD-type domain-containing protein n=1 Tax=Cryptosporidium xiaoi TaxID=659607 RepID=A0AAV9Y2I8_9CRYT
MLDEGNCVICREIEFHKYRELKFVRCKCCEGYFHRICYGVSNIGEDDDCMVIVCDPCQFEAKLKGTYSLNCKRSNDCYRCIVCFKGGVLKRVLLPMKQGIQEYREYYKNSSHNSIWIHIDCAIYSSKYVSINNWRDLSCIEVVSTIPYKNPSPCYYCRVYVGVMHVCSHVDCNKTFHIHCLIQSKYYRRKNVRIKSDMTIEAYCHKHYNINLVSFYDSKLT